ncbi:hypothetical protein [Psychroflexus sp. S27]|uniref:hypothetical protein n=1 Tax=Psychroflexus sp. S27 TaxID=1982757 RepID=UPI0018652E31|nr:hypothetical protein [Psychroflexus sp. S27]
MIKNYSKKSSELKNKNDLRPSRDTIQFILSYSQSLRVIKTSNGEYDSLQD